MSAVKPTFWTHTGSPYDIFTLLTEYPRIPKTRIAKILNINPKTAEIWYNDAVALRIIKPPFLRRKSFTNFREYFYFVNTDDPYECYQRMKFKKEVIYCTVQSGFSDMQIISKGPLSLKEQIILSGERSDYSASTPKNQTFEKANSIIEEKLQSINDYEPLPSPLVYHNRAYELWDNLDEAIFLSLTNDLRKPWAQVLRESGAYNDKVINWFRTRDQFGHTMTMYFPEGERAYQCMLFAVETEYDSLILDLFSELPTSAVFCKVDRFVLMALYIPFLYIAQSMIRRVLSYLQKKELIHRYINSIIEYSYRPD